MGTPKFKIGDELRPIKGKKSSNYKALKDLKKLIVIKDDLYPTYTKKMIKVKISKGYTSDSISWTNYYEGNTIDVYEDAFELIVPEVEDYDVY